MLRSVFICKLLILSLIGNVVCLIYLILSRSFDFNVWQKNNQVDVEDESNYRIYLDETHSKPSTNLRLLPMPQFARKDHGRLKLSNGFRIVSNARIRSDDLQLAIERFSKYVAIIGKISTRSTTEIEQISPNELLIDCSTINFDKVDSYPRMGENEAYQLTINNTGSYLLSNSLTGFIRGLSTFVQLIENDAKKKDSYLPYVKIIDQPRFVWRGLMIDVCRHWLPVEVIERTINAMEMSKMNVLHLHLSDDQGFRVQSHRHPLLHDRKDFFTQKDIQHLVEYARKRRIRIIPEFDIPGHTTSWFVGYPELASESRQYEIETRWGVMEPTMDPTNENTYTFLDGFFEEMTKLFPDDYFHIGGDEVEGSQWMRSGTIQNFIFQHQLKNKNGLQAYFNKKVEKLLQKYRKIMIGWEEIIEDTNDRYHLHTNTIIQSWKSRKSIIEAINKGYRALLSNGYYLDHILPSKVHYRVDPILSDEAWLFNETQVKQILGGEACMWTEYVSDETLDSRVWPRVFAISERLWSSGSLTDETSMYQRQFRFDRLLSRLRIGLTHRTSYKRRLEALILDPKKKETLLHPFMILADACEATGYPERSQTGTYSSRIPLTTFNDVLRCESELVVRLETMPIENGTFYDIFQMWSINHLRLRSLFHDVDKAEQKRLWVQDVEQLSSNLAEVGRIGLRLLDYGTKRIFNSNANHTMNNWSLQMWISHHQQRLMQMENQVQEIRLAAIRPVRRLLNSIEKLL